MNPVWKPFHGSELQQGDLLPGCAVPFVGPEFRFDDQNGEIVVECRDLIVITQSCDLENSKNRLAALCPYSSLVEFEEHSPDFKRRGQWEQVRKGRVEGLHMLASPDNPTNNRSALVVDFREIFSLPIRNLERYADSLGTRQRLQSPYLEHFSQSFARFFMRVGLPAAIPEFK